jgi:Protein of unknown function (DUF2971)
MPFENPEEEEFADFNELVTQLESRSYRERVRLLSRARVPISRFRYKFCSLDDKRVNYLRDILVRSRLWLSSPDDFNDPFDMSAKMLFDGTIKEKRQRINENLKRNGFNWNQRKKLIPEILRKGTEEHDRIVQRGHVATVTSTGVCCFAGDPLNILMWSHYTTNHRGLCLQFDVAKDPNTFLRAVTMKYSEEYPLIRYVTGFPEGLLVALERKHIGWQYEKETRIVMPEHAHQYLSFRPDALVGIIIGCRATEAEDTIVRELLTERSAQSYPTPKLYQACKHPTKYRLILKKK